MTEDLSKSNEHTSEEMAALRARFSELDNYEAWCAAGKPQPVTLWPKDPPRSETSPPAELWTLLFQAMRALGNGRRRGTAASVMNRLATGRGR